MKTRPKYRSTARVCFNPAKKKFYSLETARQVAEKWGHHVYPCGSHYHLTTKSWMAS